MHLKHHEKQIEDILNYLEEPSFHRIEKMEERLVNGWMIIQIDFDELKTELEKVLTGTEDYKVKFATGTLTEEALSWWNSFAQPIGIKEAYKLSWVEFKNLLIKKYCPQTKVQKMEDKFYHLTVKGNDLKTYVRRFQELATLCPNTVPNTKKLMEVFIGGLPKSIEGNITASKPQTLEEAINITQRLMDQVTKHNSMQGTNDHKRKFDDSRNTDNNNYPNDRNNNNYQNNCNNNYNNRYNDHHQQLNRRQEAIKAYTFNPTKNSWYAGNLPLCRRCRLHHTGSCCVRKVDCVLSFCKDNSTAFCIIRGCVLLLRKTLPVSKLGYALSQDLVVFCLEDFLHFVTRLAAFCLKTWLRFVSRPHVFCLKTYCVLSQDFGKENRVNILKSIDGGPYQMGKIREPLAEGTKGAPHLGPKRPQVYSDLSPEEKDRYTADIQAINILLQGLPKDIYTLINHYIDAKDIWDNYKGETIHDYYVWFDKLINDMRNIKITMSRMQLNSKFVNNMLPEWGRFVTAGGGAAGYGGVQNRVGNANPGQARQVKCYNCNEQLLFLVGGHDNAFDDDVDEQPVQDLALNVDNVFQADDCDALDSDVDEAPTKQTMFMANLSSADPIIDEAGP
nr:reverse transcriptase domain-containing protein [Tanacetum cinerariifolium]